MSFQAYLDNIKAKTGKSGADLKAMAIDKGLTKAADIVAWLKSDYGLGHGHAMAIVHLALHEEHRAASPGEKADVLFSGNKAKWKQGYEEILNVIAGFGPDAASSAGQTYINLLRGGKKFAIVQPSAAERLDIGIKLKGLPAGDRLEASGSWNAMVTHRVRITDPKQIDAELFDWLKQAYDAA